MAGLPTFTKWLARMERNQTSIGEIARYAALDPAWPAQGERGVYLAHLLALDAGAGMVAAFSHAWGNYQLAIKRAQAGQIAPRTAQGKQGAQDKRETAQGAQGHTKGSPAPAPCQACGSEIDTLDLTIQGIGRRVLCRTCLQVIVLQINNALGGSDPGQGLPESK